MSARIRKVAVLGSGVMGGAIAAHFANAGVPSLLLDIVPEAPSPEEQRAGLGLDDRRVRNRLADRALAALARTRPSALFTPARARLVETGNFEDDLSRLAEADWVVEVVREDPAIKRDVLGRAARVLRDDAVLSTNTSGLSLAGLAEALPASVRRRFLGTHFFNPPRYMRLLERIATPDTDPAVAEAIDEFARVRLGKGVVPAKDTPNFIANRIGVHAMMVALRVLTEESATIEELDAVTGPPLGRPKTGTFRLADLVGLDTLLLVAGNVRERGAGDESLALFEPPAWLTRMVERGLLGTKSGAGFYRKVDRPEKAVLVLDPDTLEHRAPSRPDLPELDALRRAGEPGERLRRLVAGDGRAARLAWRVLGPTLAYAAHRLGEIADDAHQVDLAMRLGFSWELGPFEAWDALGFRETAARLRDDGHALPDWVERLEREGETSLYTGGPGSRRAPAAPGGRVGVTRDPRHLSFDALREAGAELRRNDSASLVDLGDGVLGLEFHAKMNAIDSAIVALMEQAVDEAERGFRALVVANDGESFSAGANLVLLGHMIREGDFAGIERLVRDFQRANDRLERARVPVVVAPHGRALGGGAEVVLAGHAVQAAAETYLGLVEVGAGLVPAGGGCLRLYRRNVERLTDGTDVYPALKTTFETIGMARTSSSAEEARELGFLRPADAWSMNAEFRVHDAKALALARAAAAPSSELDARAGVRVLGRGGRAAIESALVNMSEGGWASGHDRKIGGELARILSGGDVPGPTLVPYEHLLDLEVEAFLGLCGEPKTHERIRSLLETGKPLRN